MTERSRPLALLTPGPDCELVTASRRAASHRALLTIRARREYVLHIRLLSEGTQGSALHHRKGLEMEKLLVKLMVIAVLLQFGTDLNSLAHCHSRFFYD